MSAHRKSVDLCRADRVQTEEKVRYKELFEIYLRQLTQSACDFSHRYKHLILAGLIFSCSGDILLNYDLFEAGMAGFGVAQIFYISAFGFRPVRPWFALPLYGLGATAVGFMFDNLPLVIKICLPIYGILLLTMCWRSLARIDSAKVRVIQVCFELYD